MPQAKRKQKQKPQSRRVTIDDYRFTADWFGGNILNWENWLGQMAGKPQVKFLEIGSYEGRAMVWLLGNILTHPTARIDCVDVFFDDRSPLGETKNYEERFDHNVKTALGEKKVRKIKQPSHQALRRLEPLSYQGVYIDGSHNAADVLEDAVLAFRLLAPGGIMIFDDYEWGAYDNPWMTPRIAIDAFLHVYEGQYELLSKAYQVALRKT